MPNLFYKNESDIPPRIRAAYKLVGDRYELQVKSRDEFSPYYIFQIETYGESPRYELPCDVYRDGEPLFCTPRGKYVGSFPDMHKAEEFLIELALKGNPKKMPVESAIELYKTL